MGQNPIDLNVLISTNEIQTFAIQSRVVAGRINTPNMFEIVILLRTSRREKVRILTSKLAFGAWFPPGFGFIVVFVCVEPKPRRKFAYLQPGALVGKIQY